jgi:hypothetical protein
MESSERLQTHVYPMLLSLSRSFEMALAFALAALLLRCLAFLPAGSRRLELFRAF